MKKKLALPALLTLLIACNHSTGVAPEVAAPENTPKTDVSVTHVTKGAVTDNLELFASTLYLKRNLVTAPIPAFIIRVDIRLGQMVNKGDVLYVLESKERRALGSDAGAVDSTLSGFGIIQVKAPASGVISTFDKQQTGDYVLEGALLCTIAASSDLAFQLNVPFEFRRYIRTGEECSIVLPDSSSLRATITTPLTAMNMTAQTQSILARPLSPVFLPENLISKVLIHKGHFGDRQVLPRDCLQSDEMMRSFWVMKLTNDSTAVKVPVDVGNRSTDRIEILKPEFAPGDRIVENGSYGLSDSALVKITN